MYVAPQGSIAQLANIAFANPPTFDLSMSRCLICTNGLAGVIVPIHHKLMLEAGTTESHAETTGTDK